MSKASLILFFSVSLIGVSFKTTEEKGKRPIPQVILTRMVDRYASCSSYQDEGVMITTYGERTNVRIERVPFKVVFKRRPKLFKFEWLDYYISENGLLRIVWSNKQGTFTYWEPYRYEKNESLEHGIAGATGVSFGAAYTIPSLLMPDITGWRLSDLRNLELVAEDNLEGELCYLLKGTDEDGDVNEIWIDKKDYLIRKVRTKSTFKGPDFSTVGEEIHRNIRINQAIPEEEFEYMPPIALNTGRLSEGTVLYAPAAPIWTEVTSEEGRFKLLMPAPPTVRTIILESINGKVVHNGLIASKGGITCVIDYADVLKEPVNSSEEVALFDWAQDEFLKDTRTRLVGQKSISLSGVPGREITARGYRGFARARFYLFKGRLYQLAMTQLDPSNQSANDMDKFFDSLKLTPH